MDRCILSTRRSVPRCFHRILVLKSHDRRGRSDETRRIRSDVVDVVVLGTALARSFVAVSRDWTPVLADKRLLLVGRRLLPGEWRLGLLLLLLG